MTDSSLAACRPIPIQDVYDARQRTNGVALRTPLVRFNQDKNPDEIFLKLENLQPVGSFKLRGALNAVAKLEQDRLDQGVWTASAGNMALGLAWVAQWMGISCNVIVPEDISAAKLSGIWRLEAQVTKVPFAHYQEIQRVGSCADMKGTLIHPFADRAVMAGSGTIGLEILEDAPDVDVVIVPYGGGGLSCGIASALRALRPQVKVYAAEVATAAPLAASLAAGAPQVVGYEASFVSGIGAPFVFPEMWPLAQTLLDGSIVVDLPQVAEAIRLIAQCNRSIVEGAGAVAAAAALARRWKGRKVVCVASGGNIDPQLFSSILDGYVPK